MPGKSGITKRYRRRPPLVDFWSSWLTRAAAAAELVVSELESPITTRGNLMNALTSTFEVSAVDRATEPLPEVPYYQAIDSLLSQSLRHKATHEL
jgi:hypothetical protein